VPAGLACSAGLAAGAGAGGRSPRFLWPKEQRERTIATIKKDEARRSID